MDNKPEKKQEPYSPTNTPNPPQDMDPSRLPEKNSDDVSKKKKKDSKTTGSNSVKKTKGKKSGDPQTEIDDETNR